MSDAPAAEYSEGETVVFQLSPGQAVPEEDLDSEGMLRRPGVIVETPGYDDTFGGKPIRADETYKVQQKSGVYAHVPEEQILARADQYSGEPFSDPYDLLGWGLELANVSCIPCWYSVVGVVFYTVNKKILFVLVSNRGGFYISLHPIHEIDHEIQPQFACGWYLWN